MDNGLYGVWRGKNMRDKNKFLNDYLQNINDVTACVEELNKLNLEREEIIKLAKSKNPPQNILERMQESEAKFEALLAHSNELKLKSKKLNEEI